MSVLVEAWDRVGLANDITSIVAAEKVNISTMNIKKNNDHTTSLLLTLETEGMAQLSRLMGKIEGVRGVLSVTRRGGVASVKTIQE